MRVCHHAPKSSILHDKFVTRLYKAVLGTMGQQDKWLLSESDCYLFSDEFVLDIISNSMPLN